MKKLEAVIRPHLIDQVKVALWEVGITGMTVTDVKGFSRQKGHTATYRGTEYQIDFVPKVKLDIVLPDELLDAAVSALRKAALTGKFGDGKMFVSTVDEVIRIRTGEYNEQAL